MKEGERRPRDVRKAAPPIPEGDEADSLLPGTKRSRAVKLTLNALPLTLPGEASSELHIPAAPRVPSSDPAHFDAWTLDKLRRSSLPPAMAQRAVSALPPPPPPSRTPGPELGDVREDGDALSLVGRSQVPPAFTADLFSEMSDRFALGDFTGALRAAELLLGQDPNHDLAQHYRSSSRSKLEAMYSSRLSAGGPVPELAIAESELRWLGLDSQIGMVLSRVDGASDVDTVIAGSGVPRLEALRALVELLDGHVIRLV